MKTALLGIDVGTSACKVAAFDLEGRVLAQAAESYPVLYPQPGWAEQDPQQWWEAVCKALRRLWESGAVAPGEVAGVGIDGQSWSAIPLDKEGRALCNTPIWMDTRAGSLCQELEARVGGGKIFACSGNPLSASYTLPKVLWYKEHLPQVYEKAEKVLQSNGYLAFRLTGAVTQDKSQGYGWACYNVARNQWDIPLCQELGVKPSLLPEIVSCSQVVGGVTPQAAQETGLLEGTPVVAGGLDAACGTLGAGVIHPGETQEQGGQAEAQKKSGGPGAGSGDVEGCGQEAQGKEKGAFAGADGVQHRGQEDKLPGRKESGNSPAEKGGDIYGFPRKEEDGGKADQGYQEAGDGPGQVLTEEGQGQGTDKQEKAVAQSFHQGPPFFGMDKK